MAGAKIILRNVRCSFPSLFTPSRMNEGDVGKYQLTAMIEKTKENESKIQEIKDEMQRLADEKWPKKKPGNFKWALKDGDAEDREEYSGYYIIPLRSNTKPGVVDQTLAPITDPQQIMAGDYVNVSFSMYAYDMSGNRGVGAGLNNVQFVKKGEPLGSRQRAEDEFEPVAVEDGDSDLDML